MGTKSDVVYEIDRDDTLIYLNTTWNDFALENESASIISDHVLGKNILDFICNSETRHIHTQLMEKVRCQERPLEVPFRCDSPSLRRFMQMKITPLVDNGIQYRCQLLKAEQRQVTPVLFTQIDDQHPLLRMCSWCKKVDIGNDQWAEIEIAVDKLKLFNSPQMQQITHTICSLCFDKFSEDNFI